VRTPTISLTDNPDRLLHQGPGRNRVPIDSRRRPPISEQEFRQSSDLSALPDTMIGPTDLGFCIC